MALIDRYNSYTDLQKQILGILYKQKNIEQDVLMYFTHRLLRYLDFHEYKRLSKKENSKEIQTYFQFLMDDEWCTMDEENFLLKEDNLSGDLYQIILDDREKWRLKMIQDVCNYVGIEENDPVIKGLHEMDRANFIREDMFPFADIDCPLPLYNKMTESALHAVLMTIKPIAPKKGDKILVCGAKGGYLTALLSHIVGSKGKVVGLDWDRKIIEHCTNAISKITELSLPVQYVFKEDVTTGLITENNWDIIIVNGAIPKIPYDLLYQLNDENGRILFFMSRYDGSSQCYLIKKNQSVIQEEKLSRFKYTPIPGKYGYDLIETLQDQYDEAKNKRIGIDVEYIKNNVPYPISKSFMTAFNSRDSHEKHSKSIKIAEALLKYMAFIVISVESRNDNQELGLILKKITSAASNGSWYGAVRDLLKKSDPNDEILTALKTEWNKTLKNKKIVHCYQLLLKKLKIENNKQFDLKEFLIKVIEYRNGSGDGHGYVDSETQSKEIGQAIVEAFSVILSEFNFFKHYDLIVVMGPKSMDYSSKHIRLNFVLLNGLNHELKPLEINEEDASIWLKPAVALLKKSDKSPCVVLKPWIIWTDKGSSNDYECYMFNTGKDNEYKYITYHNKAEYPDSRVKEAFDILLERFPVQEKLENNPAVKGLKKLLNIFLKDKVLQNDELEELTQYCIEEKITNSIDAAEVWIRNLIQEEYPGIHIEQDAE